MFECGKTTIQNHCLKKNRYLRLVKTQDCGMWNPAYSMAGIPNVDRAVFSLVSHLTPALVLNIDKLKHIYAKSHICRSSGNSSYITHCYQPSHCSMGVKIKIFDHPQSGKTLFLPFPVFARAERNFCFISYGLLPSISKKNYFLLGLV